MYVYHYIDGNICSSFHCKTTLPYFSRRCPLFLRPMKSPYPCFHRLPPILHQLLRTRMSPSHHTNHKFFFVRQFVGLALLTNSLSAVSWYLRDVSLLVLRFHEISIFHAHFYQFTIIHVIRSNTNHSSSPPTTPPLLFIVVQAHSFR